MKFFSAAVGFLGLALLSNCAAWAQGTTGSISGVVQDQSGSSIPSAKVTVKDIDTGLSRTIESDAAGRYRIPSLIPDHYEIQVSKDGFGTEINKGIELTVGADVEVNIKLQVAGVAEQMVVTSDAPMVETLSATVSGLVTENDMHVLPLNARSFDQLIGLESSAPSVRLKTSSTTTGASATYSVHGARDQQNRLLIDGQEFTGAGLGTNVPGGVLGLNLGVEAIREFSVLTSNYGAQYGRKSGAIVNIATRSGVNEFHGSAFEFLRNSALDARNFFDKQIPPFRRNQFGGSLGGPLKKNRAFFFVDYEGLRQNLGLSVVEDVPDASARAGILPDASGTPTFVGVNPAVAPYLSVFPLPNGPELGGGVAEAIFSPSQTSRADYYLGRVDYTLSDKDSLFARYLYSDSSSHTSSNIIYWAQAPYSNIQDPLIRWTRVYPALVNTVQVGVNRSTLNYNTLPTMPVSDSLKFLPSAPAIGTITFAAGAVGSVTTGGAITAAGPSGAPSGTYAITEYSYEDDVTYQHGPHSFQMGALFDTDGRNSNSATNAYGAFQFTSLATFLAGTPASFSGPIQNTALNPEKYYTQKYVAAYVQDSYKVRSNLTVNLGLRWEFMSPAVEKYNRISNYHFQVVNGVDVVDTNPTLGSPYYAAYHKNFGPRVGIAWDPFGTGKTSIRSGFGMFYDQIETEYGTVTTANLPFYGLLQATNPPFPIGFSGTAGSAPLPAPGTISPMLKPATRVQYNLTIQHQFAKSLALTADYVGSSAYNLTYRTDLNTVVPQIQSGGVLFFPSTGARANPALASSNFTTSGATSSYQGLDVNLVQRLSHGLQYKAAFTWSKSIDDASDTISSDTSGTPTFATIAGNLKFDRGLSSFDVGRNFVANMTYNLPFKVASASWNRWIGGWQLSSILTVADGMPFTILTGFNRSGNKSGTVVDRPNLLPGRTNDNITLGGPTLYFDPTAFALPAAGYFGNLGRDTLISPGFADLDAALIKRFPISERVNVDFRAEFFNLLNRANFGLPSNTIFNSNGTFQANAGRITNTVSTSRQIQFGLKVVF